MDHYGDHSKAHHNKRRKYEFSPSTTTERQAGPTAGTQSVWNHNSHTPGPLDYKERMRDGSISESSFSQPRKERFLDAAPMIIDWRAQLCLFLNMPAESPNKEILENLQVTADLLEVAKQRTSSPQPRDLEPQYSTIHRVKCEAEADTYLYMEEPYVINSGPQNAHLRGSSAIDNFDLFLERNKTISFIAYKDYHCCEQPISEHHRPENVSQDPASLLTGESVAIMSPELQSALQALTDLISDDIPHPIFELDHELNSPYLWWYHSRTKIEQELAGNILYYEQKQHLFLFREHLLRRLGEKWEEVDSLLLRGQITAEYLEYLFVPNTVIVTKSDGGGFGQQQAYLATSWLTLGTNNGDWSQMLVSPQGSVATIEALSWTFDGNFVKKTSNQHIERLPSMSKPFSIRDLSLYPLQYADPELKRVLRRRGEMFWQCRNRNYVCYGGETNDGIQSSSDPRFMIDIATYKQMHTTESQKEAPTKNDIEDSEMASDTPPQRDDFLLCLPKSIPGFNMNKKEWTSLDVSRITPVRWNTAAFDSLVVDKETKELISALVTNQIDAEKGTDLMSGKGNGLFILLHGGPGTGKTLTAESVAEYSEKPLYRVTCGDIGTKAEEVEKYLEVVMLLGKTWGCVVLLDEADVFLEQRRISDLQRNALVSVFLRVLEYYDGILILTSNRVGTFDEAFKSRIQLTLRYKNLEYLQRRQIWDNFITRLESFQLNSSPDQPISKPKPNIHSGEDKGINAQEVRAYLDELAKAELNGREIRNAVSTARQLAMFKRQPMGMAHIRVVIEEAKKFNDYLKVLNRGFTTDEIMVEAGER